MPTRPLFGMPDHIMLDNKNILRRIVVLPRDVENITGKKGRTARRYLQQMRKAYGKKEHQFITVKEFSSFAGIDEEVVRRFMVY
jgi:hypothetical protein